MYRVCITITYPAVFVSLFVLQELLGLQHLLEQLLAAGGRLCRHHAVPRLLSQLQVQALETEPQRIEGGALSIAPVAIPQSTERRGVRRRLSAQTPHSRLWRIDAS